MFSKVKFLSIAALLLISCSVRAVTIEWLLRAEYDYVSYYSEDIFKCKKGSEVQLVDMRMKTLLPHMVDSVTDYSDGYALVLEKNKRGYSVCGVFEEKYHSYQEVEGVFMTNRFSYCSEGFISVADNRGKQGYINTKGVLKIKCQFREARPFRKGLASVSLKAGEAHYIDASGNVLPVGITLTDASSFNNDGEALVANYQKMMIINTDGEVVRKYKMEGQKDFPVRPYDYVYDEDMSSFQPEHNQMPSFDSLYKVYSEGKKKGLKRNGKIAIWAQFDDIGDVTDELVIVKCGGRWGIVSIDDGDYSLQLDKSEIVVMPGQNNPEITCTLTSPMSNKGLDIVVDSGDGKWIPLLISGNGQFVVAPYFEKNALSCLIKVKVMKDGLLLYQNEEKVNKIELNIAIGKPFLLREFADENDLQRIKASVTNNSQIALDIQSTMYVSFRQESNNKVMSRSNSSQVLEPKETMECFVTVKVLEEESVKVVLMVRNSDVTYGSTEAVVSLKPFY